MAAEATGAISKTPRPSTVSKWRAVVLVLVHVAIAAHILHWLSAGETVGPLEPSEAVTFSQNSIVTAGFVFFVASTLVTVVFGRFFCGWGCHLLAVQDLCLWMLKKVGIKPKPMRSRVLLLVPIGAFVYMFLYPMLYRLWFGIEFLAPETEFIVENFWRTFPPWPVALLTFAVSGFAVVYFLGAKGFCVNMCPYGAAFGAVDKLSPGRIRVTPACEGCGHCTQVCSSNITVHQEVRDYGMVVDQECLKCMDCVSVCPKDALYFGFGKPALFAQPKSGDGRKPKHARDWWKLTRWTSYKWPEELLIAVLFLAALFAFRGLYNSLPFLFSLAFAGLFAYLVVQALRLLYRPRVKLQDFTLKADGKLTTAGQLHGLFGIVLLAGWGASAYINYHRTAAEQGYIQLNEVVSGWLNGPRTLTPEQEALVDSTLDHAERAERWTPYALLPAEKWELSLLTGWLHLLDGDEDEFTRRLQLAAEARPGNAVAYDGLANYHAAAGRVDEAERWFEAAAETGTENVTPWLNWTRYLLSLDRVGDARAVLVRGTRTMVEPDPAIYVAIGRIDVQMGNLDGAIEAFQSAVAVNPDAIEGHLQLAGLLSQTGDLRSAALHYESAITVLPEDLELRLAATLNYSRIGDLDAAAVHAEAARVIAPDRPEPFIALSQIARLRGDEGEAERLFAEAQSRAPAPQDP